MRNKPLRKWSNCILNDDETEQLKILQKDIPRSKHLAKYPRNSNGANAFLLLITIQSLKLGIEDVAIKIISKSNDIKGKSFWRKMITPVFQNAGKKVYLVDLNTMMRITFQWN
jgi:hypothetical protein